MPQIANYPGGFAAGITLRGMPVAVTHPGKVFWVSNSGVLSDRQIGSSNGNKGTFDAPFSTITGALAQCVAHRGDVVMVKPGHAETLAAAAGIVLSKAGVALIGLGTGEKRPTISLGTATTTSITVTASNVSVQNFLFKATFADVATVFSIANAQVATDFAVENCEFRDTATNLNFVACVKVGTTANIADGLRFVGNRVFGIASAPAAATTAVVVASDTKRMVLTDNFICHEVALNDTAALLAGGALNHTGLDIARNVVFRPSTSSTGGLLMSSSSTACSGMMADNQVGHLDATAAIIVATGTKLSFVNNWAMVTGAADKSALINPVAV